FVMAKGFRELKLTVWNAVKDMLMIGIGVFAAAFGLESFLLPSGFIDGGATGVALMGSKLSGVALPWLLLIINTPFVYLAYRIIGRPFAIRTAIGICALAVVVS